MIVTFLLVMWVETSGAPRLRTELFDSPLACVQRANYVVTVFAESAQCIVLKPEREV